MQPSDKTAELSGIWIGIVLFWKYALDWQEPSSLPRLTAGSHCFTHSCLLFFFFFFCLTLLSQVFYLHVEEVIYTEVKMSKLSCRIWTLTIGICSYLKISAQDVPSCQNTQHKEIYIRVSLVAFLFSFRFPLCIAILAVAGMQTADTLFYFLIFIFSSAYCWGLKSVRGDVLRCLMVLGFKCSVTGTASSWHSRAGRGCVVVGATVATMTSSPGIKLPCNLCFGVCSFLRRALQQVWCELQEGTEQYLWKSDVLFVGWFATNERKTEFSDTLVHL